MVRRAPWFGMVVLGLIVLGSWDCCRRLNPLRPRIIIVINPTRTATPTFSVPVTWTMTATATLTGTPTTPVTFTPTVTATYPVTLSPTVTSTLPVSFTRTATPTTTATASMTATPFSTLMSTSTSTPTRTSTQAVTLTATIPPTQTATITTTWQAGLYVRGYVESDGSGVLSTYYDIVANGSPAHGVSLTLVGPGISLDGVYQYDIASYARYLSPGSGTFQAGADYVLTVVSGVGTAAVTLQAPGMASIASDGSTVSWSPEGNRDYLVVDRTLPSILYSVFNSGIGNDLTSMFTVPGSAYPTTGTYQLTMRTVAYSSSIQGAIPPSEFKIVQRKNATVTR